MNRCVGLVFIFICPFLLSCDGPNTDVEDSGVYRGAHNDDGFRISLKINNGASITPESTVAVQLSALNATEMYITQESACNIGGVWEPYKTYKQWTLQKTNDINFFYVKVRNESNESGCSFVSIEHDSIAPSVQLESPTEGSVVPSSNQLSLVGSCDSDASVSIVINAVNAGSVSCVSGVWSKTLDVSALPAGNISVQIKASDAVFNSSATQSVTFSK